MSEINNHVFPRVTLPEGYVYIRYCSFLNRWLDFIVVVNEEDAEAATVHTEEAMSEYWDSDDECYGDLVEKHLKDGGVNAFIFYRSSDEEDDEYEDAWEAFVAQFGKPHAYLMP